MKMKILLTFLLTLCVVGVAALFVQFFPKHDRESYYRNLYLNKLEEDKAKAGAQPSQYAAKHGSTDSTEIADIKSQLSDSQQKVKGLEEQLSDSQQEVKELKKQLSASNKPSKKKHKLKSVFDDYLCSLLFWEDKVHYRINDKKFFFYSDFSCKSKITGELTFVNYFDYEIVDPEDENNHVFISMSVEKGLVFSKTRPYFKPME